MKRTFTTLALLTLSGAAAAQTSSVTLFGIADVGMSRGSGSLTDKMQISSGNTMSSRLGIRGSEDLGGGLRASFWLEGQLSVDTGAGAATNSNNQASGSTGGSAFTFGRRSTVSLHGPMGELRLGRDFTSHYLNRSAADVFGVVGVGASQPHVGNQGGSVSTRASNLVTYLLPGSLGGVYGQAQAYWGENNSGAANSKDGTGMGFRLGYAQGPLNVAYAQSSTKYASGKITSSSAFAGYDAGVVKLTAAYIRDRIDAPANVTHKGHTLGAVIPVGKDEFKLSQSRYGSDAGLKPTTSKWALGYVHNMSKRTALYATAARVSNGGGATTSLNGSTTAANQSSSGFDLGMRHSF